MFTHFLLVVVDFIFIFVLFRLPFRACNVSHFVSIYSRAKAFRISLSLAYHIIDTNERIEIKIDSYRTKNENGDEEKRNEWIEKLKKIKT